MEGTTCARCGARSELDYGYARQPLSGRVLCAPCWERENVQGLGAFVLLLVALPFGLGLLSGRVPDVVPLLWPVAVLPVLYALVAAHEAGHALVAHLVGLRVPLVSIGVGRRLLSFRLGPSRIDLHAVPLSGFAVVGHAGTEGLRWRRSLVLAAGPLVNLAVAGAGAGLGAPGGFVLLNLVLFGISIMPFKAETPFGPQRTDGLALWWLPRATAAEVDELVADSYAVEATVAYQDGRYRDAWQWATDGLELHPGSHILAGVLGAALIGLGRYREAVDLYAAQLERPDASPEHRAMHQNNLAWAALMSADLELLPDALAASEAAHRTLPWMPCVNGTRGFALILAGEVTTGAELVRTAFLREKDRRNRATMACELAIAAARQRRGGEATDLMSQARRLDAGCPLLPRAEQEVQGAAQVTGTSASGSSSR
ncbi:MAG: site-2 protease family protein [Acidimicrobiia bacterium]